MGARHESNPLQEVIHDLLQALNALRDSRPVELVEAELAIPFIGKLARKTSLPDPEDFRAVSLLATDIERSDISDIWSIRILIGKDQATTLRLEKYDSSTVS